MVRFIIQKWPYLNNHFEARVAAERPPNTTKNREDRIMTAAAETATVDFPPTERTRIKRQHERALYDRETVHAILDAGLLCHVGYTIEGQPYVTSTCYWRTGARVTR